MPNKAAVTMDGLSAANRKRVQALRRPVMDAAQSFGKVREKLVDLAPKVVKLYNDIVADVEQFTFVDFVRLFDDTVPTHAADRDDGRITGYRTHRTYYTMQYMRRLAMPGRPRGTQGVRDSATDALARSLATILQIVEDPERIWTAIQNEFQFGERVMTRLRRRVSDTKPLIKLQATRPAKVGNVIHMDRTTAPAPAAQGGNAAEPLAQPGRRVALGTGRKRAA